MLKDFGDRDMQKEMDYRGYLKEAFNLGPGDLNLKEIVEDLQEGKTDYEMFNYSTHEFFKTVQNEKTKSECRTNVKNVLFAHCVRNPLIGYTPGINLVAAYLLCFLEEEDAFWMLTHLIERIIPKDFYSKGASDVPFFGFYAESYAIKHLAIKHLELSDPLEQKSLFSFLDIILPALFMPLLVNTLNSECLFSVWDTMIRNKEVTLILIICALISLLVFYCGQDSAGTNLPFQEHHYQRRYWQGERVQRNVHSRNQLR